ncbi:MAG: hypothetical protein AAF412_11850 [Pseudomonadota bacterium]
MIGGQAVQGDYVILLDGQSVGRIHPVHSNNGSLPYSWASWVHPARHGLAQSCDEAAEAVGGAVKAAQNENAE